MVHFEIARRMYGDPSPEFLLGSLAPDSIHVRTNDRAEKNKTHLMKPNGVFATDEDLKGFLHIQNNQDPRYLDFVRGYVAHIYADRVWTYEVYTEFEKRSTDKAVYNTESNKIEFFLRRSPEWFEEIVRKLNQGVSYDIAGLTKHEIATYKDEKIRFLSNPLHEPMDDPSIITYEMVVRFADDAARGLRLLFENVPPESKP